MTEKKHSLSAKTRGEVIFSVKETSSEERVAKLEKLYQSFKEIYMKSNAQKKKCGKPPRKPQATQASPTTK